MSSLRRIKAGCYSIDRAVTMDELLTMENPESSLLPVDSLFADLPAATVQENQKKAIYNGAAVRSALDDGMYRVYGTDGEFLMVGHAEQGMLKTVKSFFEVNKP